MEYKDVELGMKVRMDIQPDPDPNTDIGILKDYTKFTTGVIKHKSAIAYGGYGHNPNKISVDFPDGVNWVMNCMHVQPLKTRIIARPAWELTLVK